MSPERRHQPIGPERRELSELTELADEMYGRQATFLDFYSAFTKSELIRLRGVATEHAWDDEVYDALISGYDSTEVLSGDPSQGLSDPAKVALEDQIKEKFTHTSTPDLIERMNNGTDFGLDDEEVELTRRLKKLGQAWRWSGDFFKPIVEVYDPEAEL
jgi:hypothetical protein